MVKLILILIVVIPILRLLFKIISYILRDQKERELEEFRKYQLNNKPQILDINVINDSRVENLITKEKSVIDKSTNDLSKINKPVNKSSHKESNLEIKKTENIDTKNNKIICSIIFYIIDDDKRIRALIKSPDNLYSLIFSSKYPTHTLTKAILTPDHVKKLKWVDEEKAVEILKNLKNWEIKLNLLNKFGINYLYHMTHIDNLKKMIETGCILSHNKIKNSEINHVDISDNSVNTKREKSEPIYNFSIHDYVPLYINPKNPMLFKRKNIQDEIILIAVDKKKIFYSNSIFTDGNAASNKTLFFNELSDLEKLDWKCINDEYWNDYEDGKRKKCAEVLVKDRIDFPSVKRIICNNDTTAQRIVNLLHKNELFHLDIVINKDMYFNNQNSFSEEFSNFDDLPF